MSKLRQLIRESINDYIREIDAAGTKAGLKAKIEETEKAIIKREKVAAMEGIDEAYHEMLDKGKMKEIGGEVKALKKSLEKLKKQLDKLNSKGGNKSEESEVEEKEIVDEVAIDENEGMGYEEEERFDADGNPDEDGDFDSEGNPISSKAIDQAMHRGESDRDNMYLNESFLHMQKLAGVITEAQYKAKKKVLNEDIINLTYNTDSDDLKYVKNILKKAGVLAKVVAGTFDDEVEITVDKDLRKKAIKALKDNGFDI